MRCSRQHLYGLPGDEVQRLDLPNAQRSAVQLEREEGLRASASALPFAEGNSQSISYLCIIKPVLMLSGTSSSLPEERREDSERQHFLRAVIFTLLH